MSFTLCHSADVCAINAESTSDPGVHPAKRINIAPEFLKLRVAGLFHRIFRMPTVIAGGYSVQGMLSSNGTHYRIFTVVFGKAGMLRLASNR